MDENTTSFPPHSFPEISRIYYFRLQPYLDEFCFRFSRRSFDGALLDRLALVIGSSVRMCQRNDHKRVFQQNRSLGGKGLRYPYFF